jgi:hypothetical protein
VGDDRSARFHSNAASVPLEEVVRPLKNGVVIPGSGPVVDATRWTAQLIEDWQPAFSGGGGTAPTIGDARTVQAVMDAARRSSAGEGWVDVSHTNREKEKR